MEVIEISVERYEELLRAEQNGATEIKIPVSRYEELVKKEAAYDMYRESKKGSCYLDKLEKIMFCIDDSDED